MLLLLEALVSLLSDFSRRRLLGTGLTKSFLGDSPFCLNSTLMIGADPFLAVRGEAGRGDNGRGDKGRGDVGHGDDERGGDDRLVKFKLLLRFSR